MRWATRMNKGLSSMSASILKCWGVSLIILFSLKSTWLDEVKSECWKWGSVIYTLSSETKKPILDIAAVAVVEKNAFSLSGSLDNKKSASACLLLHWVCTKNALCILVQRRKKVEAFLWCRWYSGKYVRWDGGRGIDACDTDIAIASLSLSLLSPLSLSPLSLFLHFS